LAVLLMTFPDSRVYLGLRNIALAKPHSAVA
jgi:hypothetical protein